MDIQDMIDLTGSKSIQVSPHTASPSADLEINYSESGTWTIRCSIKIHTKFVRKQSTVTRKFTWWRLYC